MFSSIAILDSHVDLADFRSRLQRRIPHRAIRTLGSYSLLFILFLILVGKHSVALFTDDPC